MLCKTQQSLDHEDAYAAQANELGVPAEVLDAKAVAKLDPDVTMDVAGGVYFPKDCHLSPNRFMAGLKQQCDKLGVQFVWNAEVTDFVLRSNGIAAAKTTKGEFTADEFLVAGGSWSPVMAKKLGLEIPMQAGKGYSLTLTRPRRIAADSAPFSPRRAWPSHRWETRCALAARWKSRD